MEVDRCITRNRTNRRIEENVCEIIANLLAQGFSRTDIAKHAKVNLTTVLGWERRGRADAATIDRLIESVSGEQLTKPITEGEKTNISELWVHINAIKELGFEVSLTPIR